MTRVGILDYGMGNLKSVFNAFKFINADPVIITEPLEFESCSHLVIPGVGSYAQAAENIRAKDYSNAIHDFVATQKPVLGICLGMQLMSSVGYEPYKTEGLNLIAGEVKKFETPPVKIIPHMGWNSVKLQTEHYLFEGIKKNVDFYFIHSYHFIPAARESILAVTDYDQDFCSVVYKENVCGVQFHPEKSQKHGLKMLENFAFGQAC